MQPRSIITLKDKQLSDAVLTGNQIAAGLVEFTSNLLIERRFFQNDSISLVTLSYLANSIIKSLNPMNVNQFSLSKEISILYKQVVGKKLTPDEINYDAEVYHPLDVTSEIYNGVKYALNYSILRSLFNSISSAFSSGLVEHIPVITGFAAISFAGPYAISKAVDESLQRVSLTENQKNIIRPWLQMVGRLAIGFTPRVRVNENGVVYQYPSTTGHHEVYRKTEVTLPDVSKVNLDTVINPAAQSQEANKPTAYKLHSIHSMTDNKVKLFLITDQNQKIDVQFSLAQENGRHTLEVECTDQTLERSCSDYLAKLFSEEANLQSAASITKRLSSAFVPFKQRSLSIMGDSTLHAITSKILGLTCSVVIPSMLARSASSPSLFLKTVLAGIVAQGTSVAASVPPSRVTDSSGIEKASYTRVGDINVVKLRGSHKEMGYQYGILMQQKMQDTYDLLEDFYIKQHHVPFSKIVDKVNIFYDRYSYSYQRFVEGMAEGSGLTLDQCKILNGMETIRSLVHSAESMGSCAFVSIPPARTESGATILGRNYDFSAPYDDCAKELTVTILNEDNSVPTAFISMPGQIYCPSCVNAHGMFMELNNGMPSGGYFVDTTRESLLINMLGVLQNSNQVDQIDKQFRATETDYSLIANTATPNSTKSYEFSSTLGMRSFTPSQSQPFASTNFYLNDTWTNLPEPTDPTTWLGVTRRNNLLNLSASQNTFNAASFQQLMDTPIEKGGAVWAMTIYQIILDMSDLSLYLKANSLHGNWTKVPLNDFFKDNSSGAQSNNSSIPLYVIPIASVGGLLLGCIGYPVARKICAKKKSEAAPSSGDNYRRLESGENRLSQGQERATVTNTPQTVFAIKNEDMLPVDNTRAGVAVSPSRLALNSGSS